MNFFSLFKRKLIYTLKKKISVDYDSYQGNSLNDLFFHYGSDKANIFKKKNQQGHGFSRFYENKFIFLKNEKVASIGMRIKKNYSYHGLSINIDTDLDTFNSIKPCGLDVQACNLKDYIDISVVNLKKELLTNFQQMLTK